MSAEKSEVHSNIVSRVDCSINGSLDASICKEVPKMPEQRIGRELSKMSAEIRFVHFTLEEYFAWQCGKMRLLGFSGRSLIGKLMDEGITGASQKGSLIIDEMPEKFLDVADGLKTMRHRPKMVVTRYYGNQSPVISVICSGLNISESAFATLMKEGRRHMASFLLGRGWRLVLD